MHALRVYFDRYKFKHPTPADFTAAMNEAVGQNLDWYWKQAIYGTETLDDRILTASSERVDWYNKAEEKKGVTVYHNEVIVHRRGNFRFAGGAGGEVRRWLDGARALGRQGPLASLCVGAQGEAGFGGGRSGPWLSAGSRPLQQ